MLDSTKKFWKKCARFFLRRISQLLSALCPFSEIRTEIREATDRLTVRIFETEINTFISNYPKIISEEETLRMLIEEGKSISRFGDGEYKLIIGERHKSFQDFDENLVSRLKKTLTSNHPSLLVAIQPVRSFESIDLIWKKFIIRIGDKVLRLLDSDRVYPSMGVFRYFTETTPDEFIARVLTIKKLWENRNIALVVGRNSRFEFEEELFNNCRSVSYVYGPPKNAFSRYNDLMEQVREYDKNEYLILLVLGPTATVMAHDLSLEGYQAIDFGQMPGQFRKNRRRFFKDDEMSGLEL